MTDVWSQQRKQQETLQRLKERIVRERPDYVELLYATPLDQITVGWDIDDTIVIAGTSKLAAELVVLAGFADYEAAVHSFERRSTDEKGKQFTADHRIAVLIGYEHPKVPEEDREWFDF